ncbi:hypothetical protein KQI65_12255 [bacterium]|nr:hypothetical protein [bacterium]
MTRNCFPMTRILVLLLLVLLPAASLLAQEEDYPRNRRQRGGGIVGGGGGVTPTWYFINTSPLNSALAEKGFPALNEDGMFLFGGRGYAYIMIVPNLRIGGMGYGGSAEERVDIDGLYRSTKLDVNSGGVTIEYVIPFGRFHIALGGMLGGGSYTLTMTQSENRDKTWGELFPVEFESHADRRHVLTSDFFTWQPTLSLEYEVHPFAIVDLTGGWYGGSTSDWEMDDRFAVNDMPEFDFGGGFVRLGLTFGLFLGEN